jgi:uncharacterized membrane protein
MAKTTFAGHPLHPILITAPVALLPTSLILDLMYLATKNKSYAEAAYYTMVGGYVGGAAAAVAGAGDYLTIPPKTHVKAMANLHALLNVSMLGLYSVNLLLRRGTQPPTGGLPILLSVLGSTGLAISAWYGGAMVYTKGMRVKGVSPVESAPEIKLPGDEKLAAVFEKLEEMLAPEEAPQTQPPAPQEQS